MRESWSSTIFLLGIGEFVLIREFSWLIIGDPIALTVACWIFMLIMLPLVGLEAFEKLRGQPPLALLDRGDLEVESVIYSSAQFGFLLRKQPTDLPTQCLLRNGLNVVA